ncbi:hypothetical protein [Synechococcus elongatus]|uniref:Uncharacterized protein n=2 Tax=Synechococcus elongatus TaxID=32046 RepID=A0AAN1QQA8_SYNEL|nr:hypothetical protein [Synechococcus elongatus]AZB73419.1 hypothetical protein DOP62_12505 [Synechococcus elongatus PCC 11801]QFZ93082.1 hypothetical protein EKO22_12860 [Synechococcus elongatus PCC 11802]
MARHTVEIADHLLAYIEAQGLDPETVIQEALETWRRQHRQTAIAQHYAPADQDLGWGFTAEDLDPQAYETFLDRWN